LPFTFYFEGFSPAPQADGFSPAPQADGFSPAPQAEGFSPVPQAEGFSLEPQALPQAEPAFFSMFIENKFFNITIVFKG
jgi:hypothetical protein